ncbi:hypothetical protein TNIN_490611 [Trichonephila inaurata madagascariensis]|uniref:Uncharacterized protein n=1 Tax=Trichonephila inaurata madagascariensis TaxID=2747483 RepID=A0A8X6X124_9ARAC|nr:hypothetical protein TNIN_490611 [Trichonephila inaurata madagascariensis]
MCICASFTAGTTPLPMAPSEIFRERGRKAPMWIFVCEVKVLLHERCVTKRDKMQRIEADFRKPDLLDRPFSMAAQVLLGLDALARQWSMNTISKRFFTMFESKAKY